MTVFQEMVVESILPNQIKCSWYHSFQKTMFYLMTLTICYTYFEYQSNENQAFRFFWDTRYSIQPLGTVFKNASLNVISIDRNLLSFSFAIF